MTNKKERKKKKRIVADSHIPERNSLGRFRINAKNSANVSLSVSARVCSKVVISRRHHCLTTVCDMCKCVSRV